MRGISCASAFSSQHDIVDVIGIPIKAVQLHNSCDFYGFYSTRITAFSYVVEHRMPSLSLTDPLDQRIHILAQSHPGPDAHTEISHAPLCKTGSLVHWRVTVVSWVSKQSRNIARYSGRASMTRQAKANSHETSYCELNASTHTLFFMAGCYGTYMRLTEHDLATIEPLEDEFNG